MIVQHLLVSSINPCTRLTILDYSRQYLIHEVNSLFRVTSELSRVSEDVKKFPTDLSGESCSVHLIDQFFTLRLITQYLKVAGFIEEMGGFSNIT